MAPWDDLKQILQEAARAKWTTEVLKQALDGLAHSEIGILIKSLCAEDSSTIDDDVLNILNTVFALGSAAVDAKIKHEFLLDLCRHAGSLLSADLYLPESVTLLQRMIQRPLKERRELTQRRSAVLALQRALQSRNNRIIESAIMALSLLMPVLDFKERQDIIKEVENLPSEYRKDALISGLQVYHQRQVAIESAMEYSGWTTKDAHELITIHSHKGGVGKTTIAISLAIKLSQAGRRVCLIDCDEEGPSLHHYLSVEGNNQKDMDFFSDWYCSSDLCMPSGLLQPARDLENVSYIAGAFSGLDLTLLDQQLLTDRTKHGGNYVQNRLLQLFDALLHKEGFNSLIVDTSPGLARLSFDVLLSCFAVNGSNVFVMRPRPVDICQLCLEEDWIVVKPTYPRAYAAVLNFTLDSSNTEFTPINFSNEKSIKDKLLEWPPIRAYTTRFLFDHDKARELADFVAREFVKFQPITIDYDDVLKYADTLYMTKPFITDIKRSGLKMITSASNILSRIEAQWISRRLQ